MKKSLFALSLLLLTPFVSSCSGDIPTITIEGTPTKTAYNFNDSSWDLTGIKFFGTFKDGTRRELKSNEIIVSTVPGLPRGCIGKGFKVQVKYKGSDNGYSKSYSNVTVTSETFNKDQEISEYYSGLNDSYTGSTFLRELQTHSFNKHKTWIKYGDVVSYYQVSDTHRSVDEIPGKNKNQMFYTGLETAFTSASKEHVWACHDSGGLWTHNRGENYVDDPNYIGGGADLYHIRPVSADVNTARGDATFTEISSGGTAVSDKGPYTLTCKGYSMNNGKVEFSDYVEPADEFKGDLARIICYVYMHYNSFSGVNYPYRGSLYLGDVFDKGRYSSVNAMLRAWNANDPVSEVEQYRNHTIQGIQGNRNPFVDHPEWIDKCFNN